MLGFGCDLVTRRNIFSRLQHAVSTKRVSEHVVQGPVFVPALAAGAFGIGVIKVRAVLYTVNVGNQRHGGKIIVNFLDSVLQCPHTSGTSLGNGGAANICGTDHAHEPGCAIE